ncbi:MAG: hypothetical protein HOW73_13845 [Polyangiaceae bacterium]|nr:hypothetical protein [Polyangiaceae bacterium]
MSPFVSCPDCSCAVKSHESSCPHCGVRLRAPDGSIARTAAFTLLGLVGLAGCPAPAPKYGVPATEGPVVEPTSQAAEPTSAPAEPTATSSATTSDPSDMVAPEYGVAGTPDR